MSAPLLTGTLRGPIVQENWPGRRCDECRKARRDGFEPKLATFARDNGHDGRNFYCDEHVPEDAR